MAAGGNRAAGVRVQGPVRKRMDGLGCILLAVGKETEQEITLRSLAYQGLGKLVVTRGND